MHISILWTKAIRYILSRTRSRCSRGAGCTFRSIRIVMIKAGFALLVLVSLSWQALALSTSLFSFLAYSARGVRQSTNCDIDFNEPQFVRKAGIRDCALETIVQGLVTLSIDLRLACHPSNGDRPLIQTGSEVSAVDHNHQGGEWLLQDKESRCDRVNTRSVVRKFYWGRGNKPIILSDHLQTC